MFLCSGSVVWFLFNDTLFCSAAFILSIFSLFSCVCVCVFVGVFVLVLRCDSLLWGIFLNYVLM